MNVAPSNDGQQDGNVNETIEKQDEKKDELSWTVKEIEDEVISDEVETILLIGIVGICIGLWILYLSRKNRVNSDEIEKKAMNDYNTAIERYGEIEFLGIDDIFQPEVVKLEEVNMNFRINESNASSLKEYIIKGIKKEHKYRELKALQDINLSIQRREIIGIIGTNGSGKSTLLKIISGILTPTSGSVEVDTSKVQLLTLGMGFDTELTARENVYLNGAMVGYDKEFIDKKYDYIVEFAELEGFMEEKIKNFSSGMISRLGFAIATARDTGEILILDEVLSVGDMHFKKKSDARIKEMIKGGSTVIIVSHSPGVIEANCTKAIWIEKGVMKMMGGPKEVCDAYKKFA